MASANDVAKVIKKLGTADKLPSVPAVAREMGETLNGSFVGLVYEAEPIAFPELKLPGTAKGVEKGRKSGLRFERIAARTGLGMAEVKQFAEQTGVADLYTGRGRRSGGTSGTGASSDRRSSASAKSKTASAGRGTSGRRGKTKTASAGSSTKKTTSGRRGTRASATAADPK